MKAAASALPAFLAAIIGVCFYVGYLPFWVGFALAAFGAATSVLGRYLLSSHPVCGSYLIAFWVLSGIAVMAYTCCGLLWLALHLERFFPKANAATLKELGAAVSGAATTFLGVVIAKDFQDGKGLFWPGSFFKSSISRVYGEPPLKPEVDTREADAVWQDRVRRGPTGWGFRARLERARILAEHLKKIRPSQGADPTNNRGSKDAAVFLSSMVWLLGSFLLFQSLKVLAAITTFQPASILFWPDRTYTECLSLSLWLFLIPLLALHLAIYFYQRYAVDGERFPGQLGKYRIPGRLGWLRPLLFAALVVVPSVSYGFFVGRMFDSLAIVSHTQSDSPAPEKRPGSKAGWRLLTDWGVRPDGSFGGPFESGWRWYAWQDYRLSYGTLSDKKERTAKNPHETAYPGLQPTVYCGFSLYLAGSLLWLVFRRIQKTGVPRGG